MGGLKRTDRQEGRQESQGQPRPKRAPEEEACCEGVISGRMCVCQCVPGRVSLLEPCTDFFSFLNTVSNRAVFSTLYDRLLFQFFRLFSLTRCGVLRCVLVQSCSEVLNHWHCMRREA